MRCALFGTKRPGVQGSYGLATVTLDGEYEANLACRRRA